MTQSIPEVSCSQWHRARQDHECCDCDGRILAGHRYLRHNGIGEGRAMTFKQCVHCSSVMHHVFIESSVQWPEMVGKLRSSIESLPTFLREGTVNDNIKAISVQTGAPLDGLMNVFGLLSESEGGEDCTSTILSLHAQRKLAEELAIRQALSYTEGRMDEAALLLQVSRSSLYRLVKEYGLDLHDWSG
ncbi:helix-turn-helix domain-containing protein [Vibrio splendidus]